MAAKSPENDEVGLPGEEPWRRRVRPGLLVPALLAAVTLLLFLPILRFGFLNWDDNGYLTANKPLQSLHGLELLRWAFHGHVANWHPLTWLVHAGAWRAFGDRPAGHHAISWLFHGANAALFFLVAERLLRVAGERAEWARATLASSIAAALVFALHPQRVESVAWVAETKDVLFVFFSLLAILAWLAALDPSDPARRDRRTTWLAFAFGFLALLSKPMAVTLPAVLFLVDLFVFRDRPLRELVPVRMKALAPLWAAAIGAALLETRAAGEHFVAADHVSRSERLLLALRAPGHYLLGFLAPVDLSPLDPLREAATPSPANWLRIGLTVGITLLALVFLRRGLALAWLAAVAMLGPVLGLFQVGPQGSADRFTYLAFGGLAVAVGWVVARLLVGASIGGRPFLAGAGLAVVAAWIGFLAFETHRYLPAYASSRAHWERVVRLHPTSGVAHFKLGQVEEGEKNLDAALASYRQAAKFLPEYGDVLASLASVLMQRGEMAAAIPLAEKAAERDPDNGATRLVRGQVRLLRAASPAQRWTSTRRCGGRRRGTARASRPLSRPAPGSGAARRRRRRAVRFPSRPRARSGGSLEPGELRRGAGERGAEGRGGEGASNGSSPKSRRTSRRSSRGESCREWPAISPPPAATSRRPSPRIRGRSRRSPMP